MSDLLGLCAAGAASWARNHLGRAGWEVRIWAGGSRDGDAAASSWHCCQKPSVPMRRAGSNRVVWTDKGKMSK